MRTPFQEPGSPFRDIAPSSVLGGAPYARPGQNQSLIQASGLPFSNAAAGAIIIEEPRHNK